MKYSFDGINDFKNSCFYGNSGGTLSYCALTGLLIKLEKRDSIAIAWIRNGFNPDKDEHPKSFYVNDIDTLRGINNSQLQGKQTFLYSKNKKLWLRFHTKHCPQEITVEMIKNYWTTNEGKKAWA